VQVIGHHNESEEQEPIASAAVLKHINQQTCCVVNQQWNAPSSK
jgi:hypothetical protein